MLLSACAKRRGDRRRLTESAYTGFIAQNFKLHLQVRLATCMPTGC